MKLKVTVYSHESMSVNGWGQRTSVSIVVHINTCAGQSWEEKRLLSFVFNPHNKCQVIPFDTILQTLDATAALLKHDVSS